MIAELLNILEERRRLVLELKKKHVVDMGTSIDYRGIWECHIKLAAYEEKINNLLDSIKQAQIIIVEKTP